MQMSVYCGLVAVLLAHSQLILHFACFCVSYFVFFYSQMRRTSSKQRTTGYLSRVTHPQLNIAGVIYLCMFVRVFAAKPLKFLIPD